MFSYISSPTAAVISLIVVREKKHESTHTTIGIINYLIGPEGDFSHEEIVESVNANFIPISLGKERLRTETVALAAVQILLYQ